MNSFNCFPRFKTTGTGGHWGSGKLSNLRSLLLNHPCPSAFIRGLIFAQPAVENPSPFVPLPIGWGEGDMGGAV
jgi:hypothetical protein